MKEVYDVIIVGGSYAGLSAAMALGRARRNVLIIDAGEPCNAPTPHSHNFLTQDGVAPSEISRIARDQVLKYPTITFTSGMAVKAREKAETFAVETASGDTFHSSKLLLATGVKDVFPSVPGLKDCWGISVLHCPYCHGYEVRDTRLGVLANGEAAVDFVKMIYHWSKNLVLLTNGEPGLSVEARSFLQSVDVPVNDKVITEIVHTRGKLETITFENNGTISLDALFTRLPFTHHTSIAAELGCLFTETNHIQVDEWGKTNVHGVYAAGDCTTPMRSVSIAVGNGTKAGIAINKELIGPAS